MTGQPWRLHLKSPRALVQEQSTILHLTYSQRASLVDCFVVTVPCAKMLPSQLDAVEEVVSRDQERRLSSDVHLPDVVSQESSIASSCFLYIIQVFWNW